MDIEHSPSDLAVFAARFDDVPSPLISLSTRFQYHSARSLQFFRDV